MDAPTVCLLCAVWLLLIVATVGLRSLLKYTDFGVDPAIVETFRPRIRTWWILLGLLTGAFLFGQLTTILFFFLLSITILREYITLTPKSPADHHTLFGIYLVFTPLQFVLVGVNPAWFIQVTGFTPYQVFSLLLPGCVFLVLPGMMAIAGDPKRFLERTAKLQLGLIVCVYSLSYAPALLTLDLPNGSPALEQPAALVLNRSVEETVLETVMATFGGTDTPDVPITPTDYQPTALVAAVSPDGGDSAAPQLFSFVPTISGKHFQLLFFFVLIVQLGDVFQYLWSRASRRYVVAGNINSTRTWEGILGSMLTSALLGVALWYFTPFPQWWQAGFAAMLAALMGFLGSMTMSAIKRDRGVGSYGALIPGHGGFLDRVDSLCFAAPVFYHVAWFFGNAGG